MSEVTQEDREAAAELLTECLGMHWNSAARIAPGHFARHRLAGYERGQRETVARIVAWLRDGGQLRDFNGLIRKAIEAGEWK